MLLVLLNATVCAACSVFQLCRGRVICSYRLADFCRHVAWQEMRIFHGTCLYFTSHSKKMKSTYC